MRIAAFCDFYDDNPRPLRLIIQARPGELDWSRTLFIPVSGPFEPFDSEDYNDLPGASVLLEDLVRPTETAIENEATIGILLPQIAERHRTEIQQLMLQMDDVEEVLKYERGQKTVLSHSGRQ